MSTHQLTDAQIEIGAYIETKTESYLGDDTHKVGIVSDIITETKHLSGSTIEQTLVVLTDGDDEYRVNIDNLTNDDDTVEVVDYHPASNDD